MVHSPLLTLGIFLCIANSLSFFAPWNSYISVMTSPHQSAVSSAAAQFLSVIVTTKHRYFRKPILNILNTQIYCCKNIKISVCPIFLCPSWQIANFKWFSRGLSVKLSHVTQTVSTFGNFQIFSDVKFAFFREAVTFTKSHAGCEL